MRVAVVPGDMTGCGNYRMIFPTNAVKSVRPDWEIELYRPGSILVGAGMDGKALSLKGLRDPETLDVLILQRVGKKSTLGFVQWAQAHGIAVVIDADDAMWAIDKDNGAWKSWNSHDMNWRYLDRAMELADLVTVTTDHLSRRYGKHGRVEVVDNYVPEEVFTVDSIRDEYPQTCAIGWAGFVSTHPRDLLVVGDSVRRVLEDTDSVARVVADARGAAKAWGITEIDSISAQPLGPLYFKALSTIDIALVPLATSHFNHCKSWLKALEFSAMGVPVIASPTPDNLKLEKRGIPLLFASTPEQWEQQMRWLIDEPERRKYLGEKAREIVRERFTSEGHGEEWAQAWERAATRRKSLMGLTHAR